MRRHGGMRHAVPPTTKPGPHGTLTLYRITYRDGEAGPFTCRVWAYGAEHAREKFHEGPDAEGWEVVSVRVA